MMRLRAPGFGFARARSALLSVLLAACTPHRGAGPPPPQHFHPPPLASRSEAPQPDGARRGSRTPARSTDDKLNVVVITIDAMRADMPWAGYKRDIAPNLSKLESASVSYTRAYAMSSYTAMSMAGFLSGRYPAELARSGYYFSTYPESVTLFPERLQRAGIRTVAAHGHFYFDPKYGLGQGFDEWRLVDGITRDNLTDRNVTSPAHVDLAIELLKALGSKQFFAWFHLMDPHDRYVTHVGFTRWGTGERDRYDGEIAFVDHHLGRLLAFIDQQPWARHTALIVSSDHGESFGDHKQTRHGFEVWENLVHVPMFLRIPGAAPRRIEVPRSHVDLAPTIAELLGVDNGAGWQGTSLVAEIKGREEPQPRDVIVDLPRTTDNDRRRALVHGRHKIISFGDDFRYELYDVVADPGELRDLRRDKPLYQQMKQRYLERVKHIDDVCPELKHKLRNKRPEREC